MHYRAIVVLALLAASVCVPFAQNRSSGVGAQDMYATTGLWTVGTDGQGLTLLSSIGSDPDWSPDGQRIVFDIYKGANAGAIAVVDAAGGEPVILADTVDYMDQLPVWSPDGSKVAFITGNGSLYVVNADGTGLLHLVGLDGSPVSSAYVRDDRPAWSPDGNQIAISTMTDRKAAIALVQSDGSGMATLTTMPGDAMVPTWSPDGNEIAFVNGIFSGVSIPELPSGEFEELPEISEFPDFPTIGEAGENPPADDAKGEAPLTPPPPPDIYTGSYEDVEFESQTIPDGAADINPDYGGLWLMSADGTNQRRVSTLLPDPRENPSWSPDGSGLVFGADGPGGREIWSVHVDGTSETSLPGLTMSRNPMYSPSGSRLVSLLADSAGLIFANPDGSAPAKLLAESGPVLAADWAPDGQRLAIEVIGQGMAESVPSQGIYVAAADGSGSVLLVPNASDPAPSPDGTLIAYTQYGPEGTGIFVVSWDGSNLRQVAPTDGVPLKPSWSPDGTRIAFLSYTETYAQLLSVVNLDGSGKIDLATLGTTYPSKPSWSPDGTQIAYAGPGVGGSDLWIINSDGTNPTLLDENPGQVEGPAFSPDGSLISFAEQNYEGQMSDSSHVIKPDGTGLITLTQWTAEQDPGPTNIAISSTNGAVWSPDSSRVAFPTIYGIAIANADGSGVETVAEDPELYCDIWDLSWSPVGSQFAVSRYCEGEGSQLEAGSAIPTGEYNDIYVMNTDGSDVTLVGATMLVDVWASWSPDGSRLVFTNEGAGD